MKLNGMYLTDVIDKIVALTEMNKKVTVMRKQLLEINNTPDLPIEVRKMAGTMQDKLTKFQQAELETPFMLLRREAAKLDFEELK